MLLTLEMCQAPETLSEVLKDKAQASKAYLVNCYLFFFFLVLFYESDNQNLSPRLVGHFGSE